MMGRVKTFEIVFEDNRSVYYPWQSISGKCVVDLKGDMKMRCLQIFMRGIAKVHWTESRSSGNRIGAYTEHYNAEIEYFFKKLILFGSETGIVEDVLQKGRHEFPFSFQLPASGLSTSFEGKHGSIRYWLKAEMDKLWSFNHTAKKAFTVICPIDINRSEYLVPVLNHVERTLCCWCCTSGPISLYARTDRRGYCPGESIAITADFENLSKRSVIPHASLYQTQTFLANGKTRSRRNKFTIVTGRAIQPGTIANWDAELLKIPAVSPSILNCCLIRVDYSVQITLQIPGAYNLTVDLPIVIGTTPYRSRLYAISSAELHGLNYRTRMIDLPIAPPYSPFQQPPPPPFEPPPSYAESVEGSVDIADNEEGLMGDTHFTPLYTYVHDYHYQPPPAYSEVDPNSVVSHHPRPSNTLLLTTGAGATATGAGAGAASTSTLNTDLPPAYNLIVSLPVSSSSSTTSSTSSETGNNGNSSRNIIGSHRTASTEIQ
ncbi:Arrestin domain-containing protein 3 [Chamberlinius hualienensis]